MKVNVTNSKSKWFLISCIFISILCFLWVADLNRRQFPSQLEIAGEPISYLTLSESSEEISFIHKQWQQVGLQFSEDMLQFENEIGSLLILRNTLIGLGFILPVVGFFPVLVNIYYIKKYKSLMKK